MAAPTAPARKATKKAGGTAKVAPPANANLLHPDLADFYSAPALGTARGAGTTTADPDDDLDFDTSTPAPAIPMERLFAIDGMPYFIPVEFPPGYSIVYLDALDEGRDVAVGRVLKLAIGQGWTALKDLAVERPDLITPQQLQGIMNKVLKKIMGTLEDNGEKNG